MPVVCIIVKKDLILRGKGLRVAKQIIYYLQVIQ